MTAPFNIKIGKFSIMTLINCLVTAICRCSHAVEVIPPGKNLYSSIVMSCHQPVNLEILHVCGSNR